MGLRLCAFGESTVNGTGDPDHLGWVGRALIGYRDVTLYNLGVRRETSEELRSRWKAEALARWTDVEPMRLLFSFGLNDCTAEGEGQRVSPERTVANLEAILGEARSLCPVLVAGPPPPNDPGVRDRARALNPRLAGAAAAIGVPYIDVFAALEADGTWMKEVAEWDGAHPGAGGYGRMAALVVSNGNWEAFLA